MVVFPQSGGCLCGDVRYSLVEDPVTLYACHCTDCQRQSGTSFALSMVVRRDAVQVVRGGTREYEVKLDDGRLKSARYCGRCMTKLIARSRREGLAIVEPGTLDDMSWASPVGHIWTRSAQPWISIPDDALRFDRGPDPDQYTTLARAWKERA